jgi:hypothetical protein
MIEKDLADVAPNCMRPIKSDRVETLNLDASGAAGAFDPKQFAWDLRQSHLLDGQPCTDSARIDVSDAKKRALRSNQEIDEGKLRRLANSLTKKTPYKGLVPIPKRSTSPRATSTLQWWIV